MGWGSRQTKDRYLVVLKAEKAAANEGKEDQGATVKSKHRTYFMLPCYSSSEVTKSAVTLLFR